MTGKPRRKKRRDALRGDGAIVRTNVAPPDRRRALSHGRRRPASASAVADGPLRAVARSVAVNGRERVSDARAPAPFNAAA